MGGRKEYHPKQRGKKSYQPFLTFVAETKEYVAGSLRSGYRPTGEEIARHLEQVFAGCRRVCNTSAGESTRASTAGTPSRFMKSTNASF